ncbi:MAG: lipocalin family protein [Gammaproteobacteria bacterium]|nr:lipocalin family protein [Gammaproteobacteria bacterium]
MSRAGITCMLLLVIAGCVRVPDGVETVDGFELERYLGTWYEIARLDHSFERGLSSVTATYSLREDGGVRVVNRGYNGSEGIWDEAEGKAYLAGAAGTGQLKVSFFGPFYGGYNIIALDKAHYRYSLVSGPNRKYLWILARDPALDSATLDALVATAREQGFPVDQLIYVEHDNGH